MVKTMVAQVAELQHLPMEELRVRWESLCGSPPPENGNRKNLISRLTYRMQELVYGGLSSDVQKRIEEIAGGMPLTESERSSSRSPDRLIPGTKLIREWQGERMEVTVLDSGFEWAGKRYRSLSAIATKITGTKWNGPDFFGLRKKGATK